MSLVLFVKSILFEISLLMVWRNVKATSPEVILLPGRLFLGLGFSGAS